MAAGLGLVGKDSPERLSSGVRYVLRTLTRRDGHTCLPEDRLVEAAAAELGAGREQTSEAVAELKRIGLLAADTDPDGGGTMVFEREMMENEELIARKLMLLNRGGAVFGTDNVIGLIRKAEAGIGISFDDGQKRAIVSVLSRGVLVLTGGPGTGKTTVINALMTIFESLDLKVALCAPTGRAAKRMTEATGREAKTVHRLLEVSAESAAEGDDDTGRLMTFRRDDRNPLDENAVIIDEASMLDTALCAALLRAVRPGSRVIFIGDADQLPSVGAGNVLGDLIASGTLPVVTLTHIFRQAGESLIVTNAHRINGGLMPDLSVSDRDFFFLGRRTDAEVAETVADLCARRLPAAYGDGETVQVISPSRKGLSGSESLNREIQARLNPEGPGKREYRHGPFVFRRGDRVMQVRNNYMIEWESGGRQGQGIFNGDTGVINDISLAAGYMDIDFDGRNVVYAFSDLDDLEPAYAITVHKSQGSEYPTVVISLGDVPAALRTRSLLYTAVTRAQKRVIIVGFESTVRHMVGNLKPSDRHTGLVRRLREAADRKNAGKQRR
jgi:exodeoxyribonuclease V alpha subunit